MYAIIIHVHAILKYSYSDTDSTYVYPGEKVRVITRKLARSRHSTPLFRELTRRAQLREEA